MCGEGVFHQCKEFMECIEGERSCKCIGFHKELLFAIWQCSDQKDHDDRCCAFDRAWFFITPG